MPASRVRRGRAKLIGLGLDDDGQIRYTRGEAYELYGGSEDAHAAMQRQALRIKEEIANLGVAFDSMTYEQYCQVRQIIERANQNLL